MSSEKDRVDQTHHDFATSGLDIMVKQEVKVEPDTGTENYYESEPGSSKLLGIDFEHQTNGYGSQESGGGEFSGATSDKYTCDICSSYGQEISFTSSGPFDRHNMRHHPDIRPWKCDNCPKDFSSKSALDQHKLIHSEKKYVCAYCPKKFTQMGHKISHERIHTGAVEFFCKFCGEGFRWQTLKNKHEKSHAENANNLYSCNICDQKFYSLKKLEQHEKNHNRDDLEQGPSTCHICHKSFSNKYGLTKHISRVHVDPSEMYVCDVFNTTTNQECGKQYKRKEELRRHKLTHNSRDLVCPLRLQTSSSICERGFKDKRNLRIHMVRHHYLSTEEAREMIGTEERPKQYECKGSNPAAYYQEESGLNAESVPSSLEYMIESVDNEQSIDTLVDRDNDMDNEEANLIEAPSERFVCDFHDTATNQDCGKEYKRKDMLTRHKRTHNSRDLVCPLVLSLKCKKCFKDKRSLRTHLVNYHSLTSKEAQEMVGTEERPKKYECKGSKASVYYQHSGLNTESVPSSLEYMIESVDNEQSIDTLFGRDNMNNEDTNLIRKDTADCVKTELDDSERPYGQAKQVAKSSKSRRKPKASSRTLESRTSGESKCFKTQFPAESLDVKKEPGDLDPQVPMSVDYYSINNKEIEHGKDALDGAVVVKEELGCIESSQVDVGAHAQNETIGYKYENLDQEPTKPSSSRRKQKISSRTELDQDHASHDPKTSTWVCATCQKAFISWETLKSHETTHCQSYSCQFCGMKFALNSLKNKHEKTHFTEDNFETISEGQNSEDKYEKLDQEPTKPSSSRRKQKISSRTELDQDHVSHDPRRSTWVCATCQKAFISWETLKSHETTHCQSYSCQFCGMKFAWNSSKNKHEKTHFTEDNFETISEGQNSEESVCEGLEGHSSLSHDGAASSFEDDFDGTGDTDPLL